MTRRISPAIRAIFICLALVLASTSAFATHLRGTSLSWSPTAVKGQVQFTIQYSQRTSAGHCNTSPCAVGSTLSVPITFGDGTIGTMPVTINAINSAEDWFSSTGTLLHTYPAAGPYTAAYDVCCRVSTIVSGHDQTMHMETTVSPLAAPANHSPVVSMPAIITLPLQNTTGFFISASDLDRDTLSYRMSTSTEMYSVPAFDCSLQQPPGLTVNKATGQVTWDTTQIVKAGCSFAAPKAGDLWTVQFMVEDHDSLGAVKSKVPLDVILTFVSSSEAPPTLVLSTPGPITVQVGTPINFTATGNDIAANSRITLNATGLPLGANVTNVNSALIPAVVSAFSWTPQAGQEGSYVITYSATNDTFEQVLASLTIYVQNIQPPTLTCSTTLSSQYNTPLSIGLGLLDPQADAITVIWSVDGTAVRTDSIPASNTTSTDSLSQSFNTLGAHTVSVSATDTDNKTSTCSTAINITQANQTITFPTPTGTGYGSPNVVLGATSTSGLPVAYAATGACTVVNGLVHVTGVGSCSITATQVGDTNHTAATPVTTSFTTIPVVLTITANNATRVFNTANPVFSDTFTGFVAGDSATVVLGAALNTTTATVISGVGSYPINVAIGTLSAANYSFNLVNGLLTVTSATQAITFAPASLVTFGAAPITLAGTGGASGNSVTYTVFGPATLVGNVLTLTGAGNVVVTANQAGNANYAAAPAVARTIVVGQAAQVISFPTPAPILGSPTIKLAATGGASGNPITYTVSGPATLSGNILTVTGPGLLTVTANQAGNTNYSAASQVAHTFNSTISATVTLTADSTAFSYPNSTTLRSCVTLLKGALATGSVSFYDGSTLLSTQQLNGDGCVHWYIAPALSAGAHTITAFYTDSVNTNVPSTPLVITVSRGATAAEVDCWQHDQFAYGPDFSCDANPDSGPSSGYFTYSFDGGKPVPVAMNAAGHSLFTVKRPTVGTHTMVINYPAQGNYEAYTLPLQTIVVTAAPINVALTPSTWYAQGGTAVGFNVALTSWSAGVPSSIGTVSFYDGSSLLGTVPVDATGNANFSAATLAAGSHTITASYSGNATQFAAASSSVTVQIKALTTPTITTTPSASALIYGQPLASSTLTGGGASTAGSFAWTMPAVVPNAGTAGYSVTFTPSDKTSYGTVTTVVNISLSKATPTITTIPTASTLAMGQPLAGSTLTGGLASTVGSFAWTSPATVPTAGTTSYSVTFTPGDKSNYSPVTTLVQIILSKASPTITTIPTASAITYPQTLSSSSLQGGLASTPGSFTWTTPATVPNAGTTSYSVLFTPTDGTNYGTVTTLVSVAVNKATPTILIVPTASALTYYPEALSDSTLQGGVASTNGFFSWAASSANPTPGTASFPVVFTPSDGTNYNTALTSVSVTNTSSAGNGGGGGKTICDPHNPHVCSQ